MTTRTCVGPVVVVSAVALCLLSSACSAPPREAPRKPVTHGALLAPSNLSFADVERRREAFDMTQAYRAKLGLPHSGLKAGHPVAQDRVTAILMKKRHPEFGLDHVYVQGLDDPVARSKATAPTPAPKDDR